VKKILVVEDEGVVARDIQSCILRLGHEAVGWASAGEQALRMAEETRPDLVLMDIRLGGAMDGVEAAENIRSRFGTPVVFLTAYADDETLARAKGVGPFGYVLKPFEESDLRLAIEIGLARHEFDRCLARSNEELAEEKAFLDALFDSIPSSVMVVDEANRIRMANQGLERAFKVAAETVLDSCPGEALSCPRAIDHPDSCGTLEECVRCQLLAPISEALSGEAVPQRRCDFEFKSDGRLNQMSLLVSARPLDYRGERLAIVALEDVTELYGLRRLLQTEKTFAGIVGGTPEMRGIFDDVREVADVDAPVMVLGESGTGKELVARAIHDQGTRKEMSFISVNCGALPDGLLESELFGHVKGAFTGSVRDRKGRFELADGGTIFLDEVAELSVAMQVKLLRVLQEGTFERVGGEKTVSVDARVISATNKNIEEEVAAGRFREDLFYRLCVVPIVVPPLRDRIEDVPLLVEHFLFTESVASGSRRLDVSDEVMSLLTSYSWPGNVRELQNALQFAWIKCKGSEIEPEHLPANIRHVVALGRAAGTRRKKLTVEAVREALARTEGNKSEAAKRLGVSRATLYRFLEDISGVFVGT
jgi:DNA-binding NtrC family response regulator